MLSPAAYPFAGRGKHRGEESSSVMKRRLIPMLPAVLGLLLLVGCGTEGKAPSGSGGEPARSGEVVSVGGFEVSGAEIPEVRADVDAVEDYLNRVEGVIRSTFRDISRITEPRARLTDQTLFLGIQVESIEKARRETREGVEKLRRLDPPDDLAPVHRELVRAYEAQVEALNEIIGAFDSGSVSRLNAAAEENLPELERNASIVKAILTDLREAAGRDNP